MIYRYGQDTVPTTMNHGQQLRWICSLWQLATRLAVYPLRILILGNLQLTDVKDQVDRFLRYQPFVSQHPFIFDFCANLLFSRLVEDAQTRFWDSLNPATTTKRRNRVYPSEQQRCKKLRSAAEGLRKTLSHPKYFREEFDKCVFAEVHRIAEGKWRNKLELQEHVIGESIRIFYDKFDAFTGALSPETTVAGMRAWLKQIVENVSRNGWRRHRGEARRRKLVPDLDTASEHLAVEDFEATERADEARQVVESLLSNLKPIEREIVVRHDLHGTPIKEIARDLGIREGTAYSHHSRAIEKLRTAGFL